MFSIWRCFFDTIIIDSEFARLKFSKSRKKSKRAASSSSSSSDSSSSSSDDSDVDDELPKKTKTTDLRSKLNAKKSEKSVSSPSFILKFYI